MVTITAFKALKYDLGKNKNLSKVVSLPYDVITPEMQDAYYSKSDKNIVRIILRKETGKGDRYVQAAKELNSWISDGTLNYEKKPVLFVHQQQFLLEGEKKIRTGLLCLVRLEEFARKNVLPHEHTFPSHKADRLKLLEACGANMSPVFGLYEGSYNFKSITSKKPYAVFKMKDKNGPVLNKVWVVRDEKSVLNAVKAFKNKKVFIADGHHRYEVGLFYKNKMRKLYPASTDSSWNYIMFTLVSLHDKGLVVLPTHRLVRFVFKVSKQKMFERLSPYFEIEELKLPESKDIILYTDNRYYALKPKGRKAFSAIKEKNSVTWKKLPTALLHHLILKKLPQAKEICYTRDIPEVKEKVNSGIFHAGFIIPDISAKTIMDLSYKMEKMPHKTTYFYPKLPVGITFNKF
ncbi:MAG: hypothetical protein A2231_06580 [Candidatus Firestonebacteria bacterium RIFOXYA2_FULL_40_8]|nr:MAG: hypothetical protein A2231_06580 [Candidatus Firestonebacteria bacterium RIFOXYA2_FULL_40_8]